MISEWSFVATGARGKLFERALVVPGAEQAEGFAGELAGEQPVNFIHAPNQARFHAIENLAPQKPVEIHAWTASRIPGSLGNNVVESKLLGDAVGQRDEKRVERLEMSSIELLEVRQHNLRSRLA